MYSTVRFPSVLSDAKPHFLFFGTKFAKRRSEQDGVQVFLWVKIMPKTSCCAAAAAARAAARAAASARAARAACTARRWSLRG